MSNIWPCGGSDTAQMCPIGRFKGSPHHFRAESVIRDGVDVKIAENRDMGFNYRSEGDGFFESAGVGRHNRPASAK